MHHAPAVDHPVQRSPAVGVALMLVWLTSACLLLAWAAQSGRAQGWTDVSAQWLRAGVALTWVLCGGVALWQWLAMPQGQLRWDGLTWQWSPEKNTALRDGYVAVVLDLQVCLLVHWRTQTDPMVSKQTIATAWLWLRAEAAPAHWHGLRCAVYSPAPVQNQPAAAGLNT